MPILTLLEVKAFPGITGTDAHLQLYIDAVEPVIEEQVGPVVPRVITLTVTSRRTLILAGRVVTLSVARNGTVVTDYTLNAAAGLLSGVWPGDVVTYTVGFDPIPAAIRLAALYAVQHAAESASGSVPQSGQFGGDEVFTTSRGFFLPNRSKELLEPYRQGPVIA